MRTVCRTICCTAFFHIFHKPFHSLASFTFLPYRSNLFFHHLVIENPLANTPYYQKGNHPENMTTVWLPDRHKTRPYDLGGKIALTKKGKKREKKYIYAKKPRSRCLPLHSKTSQKRFTNAYDITKGK